MTKTFDLQPQLNGTLIELRPLRATDFDALYAVAADPLIWEQHPARDRFEEGIFRDFFEEALHLGGTLVAVDRRVASSSAPPVSTGMRRVRAKSRSAGRSLPGPTGAGPTTAR